MISVCKGCAYHLKNKVSAAQGIPTKDDYQGCDTGKFEDDGKLYSCQVKFIIEEYEKLKSKGYRLL